MTIYELGKMREQVDAVASTKDVVQTPLGSVTGFDFAQTERLAQAQKVFDRLDEATTAVRTKAEDARKKVEGLTADSAEEERTEAQNDLVSAKSNLLLAERRLSDAYDNLTLALRQRLEARTPPRTNSADVVGLEMRKCPFDADIRGAL